MKQRIICKGLAVAAIVLFLGLAVQPSIAVQSETEIEIEPKDYLFQTIIDIANNPDVKELIEQYDNDLFKVNIDRSVYRKLMLRNPRLLFNTLFTKPSISVEYLNKCYNNGVEITNILGEDKVSEIMENVEVTDRKLFDEFKNIITKDEELSNRLEILKEMNKEQYINSEYQIICSVAMLLVIFSVAVLAIFELIFTIPIYILYYIGIPLSISLIPYLIITSPFFLIGGYSFYLLGEYDCIDFYPDFSL